MHGVRGTSLLDPNSKSKLKARFRSKQGLSVGEAYRFISSLYFRGKLTYGLHFGGASNTRVLVPGFGLVGPDWTLTPKRAERARSCPVDPDHAAYRRPLERDLRALLERESDRGAEGEGNTCEVEVVFLGSLATRKYLDVLVPLLGGRLLYPKVFVGCGDMRRGSLLLKAVDAGQELEYAVWRDERETV